MTERTWTEAPVIAQVVPRYYSLTENWIHTQVKHLTRYQPLVLTLRTENLAHDWRPDCYALLERSLYEQLSNRAARRVLGYFPAFRHQIRRVRAKAIHVHFGSHGYFTLPLSKATRLPLVTSFYGLDLSKLPRCDPRWRDRYKILFEHGARFLVEGPFMAAQLCELGCPEEKVSVQHLGVELDQFPFQARRLDRGEPFRILVAARFSEKKGIIYAVEAVALLRKQGIDVRLTLIGDAGQTEEDQETKRRIMSAIRAHAIRDQVDMRGMLPRKELTDAYYHHHVFLQPSVQARSGDNEGGAPVTLVEAAASGMPIIATRHCDIPAIVRNGKNGLLAPERDSQALAHHLLSLVTSPARIGEMGAEGRRHIEAKYDAKTLGQRLEAIYDEVVNQRAQDDSAER